MTEGLNMRLKSYRGSLTEQSLTFNLMFLNGGGDQRGSWVCRGIKQEQQQAQALASAVQLWLKLQFARRRMNLWKESLVTWASSCLQYRVSDISGVVAVLMEWRVFAPVSQLSLHGAKLPSLLWNSNQRILPIIVCSLHSFLFTAVSFRKTYNIIKTHNLFQ